MQTAQTVTLEMGTLQSALTREIRERLPVHPAGSYEDVLLVLRL